MSRLKGINPFQDIAYPSPLVSVVHPIKDDFFDLHGLGIRDQSNHSIGYHGPKVSLGINVLCFDFPNFVYVLS